MKGKLIGGLAFLGAVAILYVFAMPTYRQGEPSLAGRMAPDFPLELGGKATRLSELRGKVVVLNFWATWCPPCVQEMPSLIALHQRIADRGGMVLGVSLDDDREAYEQFLTQYGVIFPTYLDASKAIPAAYGTSVYPETYIIGRDGRFVRKIVGPQEWTSPDILALFDTLLRAQ
jgi:peroxiredoxin